MKKKSLFVLGMMLLALESSGNRYIEFLGGAGMEGNYAALADRPAGGEKQDKEAMKAFVQRFYEGWEDIQDYAYLKKHVTPKLLQFLADSYDFECEGECLATWLFFYEGGGDVGELKSRKITVRDSNHVLVESKYENYVYGVLLTVVKDGSAFKIDSLQKEKSEYVNAN